MCFTLSENVVLVRVDCEVDIAALCRFEQYCSVKTTELYAGTNLTVLNTQLKKEHSKQRVKRTIIRIEPWQLNHNQQTSTYMQVRLYVIAENTRRCGQDISKV